MNTPIHRFDTEIGEVTVRAYAEGDVGDHVKYLYESPEDFLTTIAFDVSQFPSRDICTKMFLSECRENQNNGELRRMASELNGHMISYATIEIPENESKSYAHFHIIESKLRGKGLGSILLSIPLKVFTDRYELERIYIEPSASNAAMNRLMQKLNFLRLDSFEKAAGMWALPVEVTQYEASREQIEENYMELSENYDVVVSP